MADDLCFKTRKGGRGSGRSNHSSQLRSPPTVHPDVSWRTLARSHCNCYPCNAVVLKCSIPQRNTGDLGLELSRWLWKEQQRNSQKDKARKLKTIESHSIGLVVYNEGKKEWQTAGELPPCWGEARWGADRAPWQAGMPSGTRENVY